ncbi:hypothetical protein O181_004401 [Austropuccinia psidii MF-1]|uniref:Peroxisomal ATPase PEX1 n=1 Tax=Austropuccinia psidii MF-1 TaxID=1389203 RepID=A0A9Q3BFH4_9BASI|nr:hypothetical protein [Austropuccinia psidii MF-1]
MSRQVNLRLCDLRSSLINLPPILAAQLSNQGILPQFLGIEVRKVLKPGFNKLDNKCLYVGWTGLTTSEGNEPFPAPKNLANRQTGGLWSSHAYPSVQDGLKFVESIEIDEALAAEMGWQDDDRVSIRFYHELKRATTVHVEPLSIDDWEILESNPQYLEDNILKQIRVLSESQTLLVWIYAKTLIKIRVKSILPSQTIVEDCNPSAPWLITNDTEIIVSPKSRFNPLVNEAKQQNQVLGGFVDTATEIAKEKRSLGDSQKLDLKILPHAFPLALPTNISTSLLEPASQDEVLVASVNPLQFSQVESTYPSTLCSLTLLPRLNQASTSKSTSNPPLFIDPELPPRNLSSKPSKANKPQSADDDALRTPSIADRVRIVSNPTVPVGFIHLPSNFKQTWFSNFSTVIDAPTNSHVGKPGDYEYVRIGEAKEVPIQLPTSPSKEHAPPTEADIYEKASENILLSGFRESLEFCERYVQTNFVAGHLFTLGKYRTGNQKLTALMVCGSSGTGKTSLVKKLIERVYINQNMMLYSRYVDCGKHVDDRLSILKSNITEWFDDAVWHSPSLLVLDDLDKLFPAQAEHIDSFRYRHLTEEFLSICNTAIKDRLVILIGTCSSSASIHNLLASETHFFAETLLLKGLSRNSRQEILAALIEAKAIKSSLKINPADLASLASEKTEGYAPSDLKDLVDGAVHQAIIRSMKDNNEDLLPAISLELVDFENVQSDFVPISLREVKLQKNGANWSDIGGLAETRRILRETLEWPSKYPAIFVNCPLRLRSGLLLYGYPGCGKTLLASAIAKECGLNFISIKGPELLNKYIGASEKSVRDLFERAQQAKPCVLFFDEFESIAPKRGHDSTGVTDRVVNQLLTQMDGAEAIEGVYVLAATSRPDLIDPALLRPGRLDKSLLCSMPNEQERLEILKAVSRTLPLIHNLSFDKVARATEGFTGADLQALVYSAHLEVVNENILTNAKTIGQNDGAVTAISNLHEGLDWTEIEPCQPEKSKFEGKPMRSRAESEAIKKRLERVLENTSLKRLSPRDVDQKPSTELASPHVIETRHLLSALKNARRSVPQQELVRLTRIYRKFVSSRSDGGLPDGEASEEIGGRASLM